MVCNRIENGHNLSCVKVTTGGESVSDQVRGSKVHWTFSYNCT